MMFKICFVKNINIGFHIHLDVLYIMFKICFVKNINIGFHIHLVSKWQYEVLKGIEQVKGREEKERVR